MFVGQIAEQATRIKRVATLQRKAAKCYARADHWREQADRCGPNFQGDRIDCLNEAIHYQICARYLSAVVRREMGID